MIRRYPNGATLHAGGMESERRQTRGTETSQYPLEQKSTEIPQVVASERGTAQTEGLALRGCGTSIRHVRPLDEASGKLRHRR